MPRPDRARSGGEIIRDHKLTIEGEHLRILNLGVSQSPVCGVRDYALRLGEELTKVGHTVESEWLERPTSIRECLGWIRSALSAEKHGPVDVVLWHYSVFAYSSGGIPTLSYPFSWALWRARSPIVAVLHEYTFPWGRGGLRGTAWALSHRFALPFLVAASSGLVVTVQDRAEWLRERRWLLCRPVTVTPVFSNLPEPIVAPDLQESGTIRIGMFGYPKASARLIVDAMANVRASGTAAELWLLGSPGQNTSEGEAWRTAGRAAGVVETMKFTGILGPEALANEIRQCDILIFDDGLGPSSRKTTLAAILASGRPVVAVVGPNTWPLLTQDGSVRLVARNSGALGDALIQLANDTTIRDELGARCRAFYERHQSREVVAAAVSQFLLSVATSCRLTPNP